MNLTKRLDVMRDNGIIMPGTVVAVAEDVGIPVWVGCSFLEMESGGGRNVYGHDVYADGTPKPFWGHGVVTEQNYKAYKIERDLAVREPARFPHLGRRMQGVGPMQLTWWEFQDRADDLGGCWRAVNNIRVGFELLAEYRRGGQRTWREVAVKYNGSEAYGDRMVPLFREWRDLSKTWR